MWLMPGVKQEVLPPWPEEQAAPAPAAAPVEPAAEEKAPSPFPWDPNW
jgi:hypothetical protein